MRFPWGIPEVKDFVTIVPMVTWNIQLSLLSRLKSPSLSSYSADPSHRRRVATYQLSAVNPTEDDMF
jgi:hypothetical protein